MILGLRYDDEVHTNAGDAAGGRDGRGAGALMAITCISATPHRPGDGHHTVVFDFHGRRVTLRAVFDLHVPLTDEELESFLGLYARALCSAGDLKLADVAGKVLTPDIDKVAPIEVKG